MNDVLAAERFEESLFQEFARTSGWPDELAAERARTLETIFPNADDAELEEVIFNIVVAER